MIKNGVRPVHPGEVLREDYLAPFDMSADFLAKALRVTPSRVNEIVREEHGITADTAMRLARYFDTTSQFWMSLQSEYDLRVGEITSAEQIKREITPHSHSA